MMPRTGLCVVGIVALLMGCGSTVDEADSTSESELATIPACQHFDLDATIAAQHSADPRYQCRVSAGLTRSSQPDEHWIRSLADPAIRHPPFRAVVNLRGEHGANGEDPIVRRYGMTPLRIAVLDKHAPTRSDVIDFLAFVTAPENQPALVHCLAGQGRTGTFVAAYRMAVQGWSLDDALAEAEAFRANAVPLAFLRSFAKDLGDADVRHFRNAVGSHP